MARSDILALMLLALASCAHETAATPAATAFAPAPQLYSCGFSRRLKVEYDALSSTSALRLFVDDAILLRDKNRAVRGDPKPAPCPAEGERR